MTFEEMQNIIEGMLAVQRELQESQLTLKESQLEFRASQEEFRAGQEEFRASQEEFRASQEAQKIVLDELIQRYGNLAEQSIRQKEILDRLIGYSLTNESEHLNLEEKLQALEARIKRFEERNQT
ncbi:hypothetical protein [Lusitaniella coriacea]|uniref:hypothetical protein n=1 Tax=Lusitaniella coriacea TaxID=1983105 RepID=UPI003CF55A7C